MTQKNPPLQVFLSYSRVDSGLLEKLKVHLAELEYQKRIEIWYDEHISLGERWDQGIDDRLEEADLILLLISPEFLASEYCRKECKRALERKEEDQVAVVPILLRDSDWKRRPGLASLQGLPRDGTPIARCPDQDNALNEVAREIGELVEAALAATVAQPAVEVAPELGANLRTPEAPGETGASPAGLYGKVRAQCEPLRRLYTRAALLEAKARWEVALSFVEEREPRSLETGSILYELGLVQRDLGDLSTARELLQRSLDLTLGDPSAPAGQVVRRLSDLAEVLRRLGDLVGAWELVKSREQPSGSPLETLLRINVRALILKDQGNLKEAQAQLSTALGLGLAAGLTETPELAATRVNLALLYKDSGDYEAAENQLLQALAIDEEHYGPEHPEVAFDSNALGLVLQARGNYRAARAWSLRAHQILSQALGEDHPHTASVWKNREGLSLRGFASVFLGHSAAA